MCNVKFLWPGCDVRPWTTHRNDIGLWAHYFLILLKYVSGCVFTPFFETIWACKIKPVYGERISTQVCTVIHEKWESHMQSGSAFGILKLLRE